MFLSLPPPHVSPANYASLLRHTTIRTFTVYVDIFRYLRLEIAAANVVTVIDGLPSVISRGQIVWVYHIIKLLQVSPVCTHSPTLSISQTAHHLASACQYIYSD